MASWWPLVQGLQGLQGLQGRDVEGFGMAVASGMG